MLLSVVVVVVVVVEFISCNQTEKIWANDCVKSVGSRVERSRAVFCTCDDTILISSIHSFLLSVSQHSQAVWVPWKRNVCASSALAQAACQLCTTLKR